MNYKTIRFFVSMVVTVVFISCSNNSTETSKSSTVKDAHIKTDDKTVVAEDKSSAPGAEDGPAIATIETNDFVLKIHRAIPFTLKPKSYEPFKVDPSTKLVVLDVSVRNKLSTPLDFSRILGMTQIKNNNDKNLVAPWVVAAYEVDYPELGHQKEYDALWSQHFDPNGFHRAILFGLNPKKEENNFTLIVPSKADFNNPMKKEAKFSL